MATRCFSPPLNLSPRTWKYKYYSVHTDTPKVEITKHKVIYLEHTQQRIYIVLYGDTSLSYGGVVALRQTPYQAIQLRQLDDFFDLLVFSSLTTR